MPTCCCVGIDVAKAHLDVHLLPAGLRQRFGNDPQGHRQLLGLITPHQPHRIALEATGGYERPLLDRLIDASLPATLLNPQDVRRFARAGRILAKNDRIDAGVLAQFALRMPTRIAQGCSKIRHVLRQLVMRRRQLVEQCTQLRNHLEHADVPMVIESIKRSMTQMREELKTIESLIQQQIDAEPTLKERQQKLLAVAGIGPAVSAVLVSELPELGQLHRRKLAALVGVAPFDNDSGNHRGVRSIRGGRHTVRNALYMATLVGVRREPHLRAHYQQLITRGKPKKVALVACMNKRLNYLNALLRTTQRATAPAAERNEAGSGAEPQKHHST